MTAHWGVPDPAAVVGSDQEKAQAFDRALHRLSARIGLLVNLRLEKLEPHTLKHKLQKIGRLAD